MAAANLPLGADTARLGRPLRVLDVAGNVVEPRLLDEAGLSDDDLRAMYRDMVVTRRVDEEAIRLQRQGQLGVYASSRGQEAAQVGSAHAAASRDWIFPSYREIGAAVVRGLPPSDLLHLWRGTWFAGHDPSEHRFALYAIPIATQCLHAVGFAMGSALQGSSQAVLSYLGDGATSEGDAHEAFNFAAVRRAPVVFFVQNNQYAISLSFAQQSGSATVAQKGIAYGMPALRCDGNDVIASHLAARRGLDRARNGDGPTLVEAVTYRLEAHTTADDASRYRDDDEIDRWRRRDPILRLQRFLTRQGLLDTDADADIAAAADQAAARVRAEIYEAPAPDPAELFDHVYVDMPASLAAQRDQMLAELRGLEPDQGAPR